VLEGTGGSAPFSTLGGLDNTWIQGRRASRFFINDNLAWSAGAHELRFGTNTRIFRLNDFDFGEGTVPTVTYTDLPQFIYGVASTATTTFPLADSQPFNFLNVDLYAQDTWKLTKQTYLDPRRACDAQFQPAESSPGPGALAGAFDAISHDVDQPLSALIQTHVGNLFESTPAALWQPRTAVAWEVRPGTVVRTGFGLFSDLLPGSVADLIGVNPPYVNTFRGGLLGTVGGIGIAPGVPGSAVDATAAANQSFLSGFAAGELSCASPQANPAACLPPVSITAVPTVSSMRRISCSGVCDRTSVWRQRRRPGAVCGDARGGPALHDTGQRIPDGLPRVFCAVCLWLAAGFASARSRSSAREPTATTTAFS
jgi:hypothetical protein